MRRCRCRCRCHRRRHRIFRNDDLLLEILSRVSDIKSMAKCTAVYRRWFGLVYSNYYRKKLLERHESKSQPLPCTLIFRYDLALNSPITPVYEYFTKESQILHSSSSSSSSSSSYGSYLDFLPWNVRIYSSFEDLLVVSRFNSTPFEGPWHHLNFITICNPFTKQWLDLPQTPYDRIFAPWAWVGLLVLDRTNHNKLEQLRYKVVVVWKNIVSSKDYNEMSLKTYKVITFCSEIGKWSSISTFLLNETTLNDNAPVACNGMLHWLVSPCEIEIVDGILAFDPIKVTNHHPTYFRYIDLPIGLRKEIPHTYAIKVRIGLVCSRLRLSQLTNEGDGFVSKVWELNYDDNNNIIDNADDDGMSRTSWTLVHDVRVKRRNRKRFFVIAFHPDNGNMLFLVSVRHRIYQYNIAEEKINKIGKLPNCREGPLITSIRIYTLLHPLWPTPIPALQDTC